MRLPTTYARRKRWKKSFLKFLSCETSWLMRKGLYNNIWGILFWALYTHRVPGPKRLQLSRARQKRGRGGEKIAAQRREAMPKVTPSEPAALLGAQHGRPGPATSRWALAAALPPRHQDPAKTSPGPCKSSGPWLRAGLPVHSAPCERQRNTAASR